MRIYCFGINLIFTSVIIFARMVFHQRREHRSCPCRFLQSSSKKWRMTCFWWQLTHNITVHILRLPLKRGCLEICGLCPEEVALLVSLDGEHPSSGHIVLRFDHPQINEIKNLIVNPGFLLEVFRFGKLLLVSSYFHN